MGFIFRGIGGLVIGTLCGIFGMNWWQTGVIIFLCMLTEAVAERAER